MKNSTRIGIFIGALLITFIFSTAFASAQTECVNCHEDTFTASKVDRVTSCGVCHNSGGEYYIWYHTELTNNYIDGYGFFKIGTDPVNISAPDIHIKHKRTGQCSLFCHQNEITCNMCHETASVYHSSHGSPISTYTCENALCHNKTQTASVIPYTWNITQSPACSNCHTPHDISESHQSDLTQECESCHSNYLPDTHNEIAALNDTSNCSVCHQSTNETVIAAIANNDTSCNACHTLHGDITVLHTTTASYDCVKCHHHDANVIITHKENCILCHDKSQISYLPDTPECFECHADGSFHNDRGKNHPLDSTSRHLTSRNR